MPGPPVVFANLPDGLNPLSLFDQCFNILFGYVGASPTFITSGSTYAALTTDTRILLNKAVASSTAITLPLSAAMTQPCLVKDIRGTVNVGNAVTVSFSGGQTCQGFSSVTINAPYGGWWFNPLAAGGWYLLSA